MARFDFQSPGAAFTGQIAEVLAKRKAEERQSMLDQLTMNADMRAQEAAQRDAAAQKAQLENQAFERNITELGLITRNMRRGDDPTARGVNPELFELGKKYGMFEEMPTPQVSTTTDFVGPEGTVMENGIGAAPEAANTPPPPPRWGFVGNAEERVEAEDVAGDAKLIARLMENPETRKQGQYLMDLANANRGRIPEGVAEKYLQPDVPFQIFDQATGELRDGGMVSPHAQVATLPRPPRDHRPRNLMPVIDREGNLGLIDQETIPVDPITGIANLPEGYTRASGGSGADGSQPLGITNRAYDAYVDELSLVEPDETGKVPAGPMLAVRQRAAKIISEARTTPKVRDLAARFIANPSAISEEALTEKEALQFRQLIGVLAADSSIANLYRQNAIQVGKPGDAIKSATQTPQPQPAAGGSLSDVLLGRIK